MARFFKYLSIGLIATIIIIFAVLFFLPKPLLLENASFSRAVYSEQHKLLRLTLSRDEKYRLYTPLSAIPQQLIDAVLLKEDRYFYWHLGVNPVALVKATLKTYLKSSRRLGASTITMQLVRIRYQHNSRTVSGKIWQIIRAVQLEMHYSKPEILEAYLNLAPYGNNIEGVGAASLIYYAKPLDRLSLSQLLLLSVIPQNPNVWHNVVKISEMRAELYARWLKKYPQDQRYAAEMKLPLQLHRPSELPFLAPHLVDSVLMIEPPNLNNIVTTLDWRMQQIIERVLHSYVNQNANLGINNAAALLVDVRDMKVKALVGSADFFGHAIHGQVNGVIAKRSPGSTLKPFIYALALDQGLIHPATVLKDVAQSFGGYDPENFDYEFLGPITAQDALNLSRNVPAVFLANNLTAPDLYQFLKQANVSQLKSKSYYGLALALGGVDLSLQELVGLYAMLVNDGVWHPIRSSEDQQLVIGKRLLSPEASFLVLDMLEKAPRPDLVNFADEMGKIPIAWKTGTSTGYRDAWTVGVFGPYVLGIWIGNFNGHGNPSLVGRTIAAPLFFAMIDAIMAQTGSLPVIKKKPQQLQLTKVTICKASGLLPTKYCHETTSTWFIPGKSPIKTDNVFREIAINNKTGFRACQYDENTKFAIYEFWPTDLLKVFEQAGIKRRTPPPFASECQEQFGSMRGMGPEITSPQKDLIYPLRVDSSQPTIIPFTAITDADVMNLYWFINDQYLGKTKRDQPLLWNEKPGKFIVRVVDDHGRVDSVVVSGVSN